jgi:hypothetical protein
VIEDIRKEPDVPVDTEEKSPETKLLKLNEGSTGMVQA